MEFKISHKKTENENEIEISVDGDVTISNKDEITNFLNAIENIENLDIIVNCSELNFIDSTGLGIFIRLAKSTKERGKSIKLVKLRKNIFKLFTLTGIIPLFDLVEEA